MCVIHNARLLVKGAKMGSLKRVLLGSAAGLVAVAAAQAADVPVKGNPVEYVRVCDLYGAGFWYVPGTDTCIKIGAYTRVDAFYGATGAGAPIGLFNGGSGDPGGAFVLGTNNFNFRNRNDISFDMRTQTEYGTLRSYIDIGSQISTSGFTPPGLGVVSGPSSIWLTRAFLQFAGFTAGRIRSFFDMVNPGAFSLLAQRTNGDTAVNGIVGLAYTYELGGGWSASLSFEDPGYGTGGHGKSTVNLGGTFSCNTPQCSTAGLFGQVYSATPPGASNFQTAFGLGYFATDNDGMKFPDPILNIRIDQPWGFAGISAALHDASGGYYGTCLSTTATVSTTVLGGISGICNNPSLTTSGHPAEATGYALSAAFSLSNMFGLRGDSMGLQGVWTHGAAGYATSDYGVATVFGSGNNVGLGYIVDGVYNNGTSVALTNVWSVFGYYEHIWNAKWRTSVYGGIVGEDFGSEGKALICPNGTATTNPVGFTFPNPNYGGAFTGGVTNCNPNTGIAQFGTRTIWNPVPDVDIGFDVGAYHLNTAFAGQADLPVYGTQFQPALYSRPGGVYNITNQNTLAAAFRFQRNFLY